MTPDQETRPEVNEEVQSAPKVERRTEDVTAWANDNEQPDAVHCTLTFTDGGTATGSAPHTGDLAADQATAAAAALAGDE